MFLCKVRKIVIRSVKLKAIFVWTLEQEKWTEASANATALREKMSRTFCYFIIPHTITNCNTCVKFFLLFHTKKMSKMQFIFEKVLDKCRKWAYTILENVKYDIWKTKNELRCKRKKQTSIVAKLRKHQPNGDGYSTAKENLWKRTKNTKH